MKDQDSVVIVLCGGDINAAHLPIATSGSNAMIPVNGKPVIGWILSDLAAKKAQRVIIVTQADNDQLQQYVLWAFNGRLSIEFALLHQKGSIVDSLFEGMKRTGMARKATIILGDTYIPAPYPDDPNFVLVSQAYEDPRNWCLVQTDAEGHVCRYFDKENTKREGLLALTGLYGFNDAGHLFASCEEAQVRGARELSEILTIYAQKHPIRAVVTSQWYDFGHMPHFLKAKHELLQSRYFNEIKIDTITGVLHKTSQQTEKLRDEYLWYLSLPEHLAILTPRVLGFAENAGSATLVQEYYGYPNLAELYLYGNFDLEIWKVAIDNLIQVHQKLKSVTGEVSPEDAFAMYWEKTESRVETLQEQDDFFKKLISMGHIIINGIPLLNYPNLKAGIKAHCKLLANTVTGSVVHGDFCLSNILYDIHNQLVRLIDPRGSFGKKGVFGDPRYEMAKLRHSFSGGYDFMVADLFSIEQKGTGQFETSRCDSPLYAEIASLFDAELVRAGYSLPDIIFIESLLFLSMAPLHSDKPERQLMMYLQAIKTLNDLGWHWENA